MPAEIPQGYFGGACRYLRPHDRPVDLFRDTACFMRHILSRVGFVLPRIARSTTLHRRR